MIQRVSRKYLLSVFCLLFFISVCHTEGQTREWHTRRKLLIDALDFINEVNQPKNCTGLTYSVVGMGINGGFAAQFQLAASEWMRAFAASNYSRPILIEGSLKGYSVGRECAHVNHDWTCFFHPMSSCQKELLRSGKRVDPDRYGWNDDDSIPPKYRHLGFSFWWGVVQFKMFRLLPVVERYVADEARSMMRGHGFPFGLTMAGMHVRHGDKHVDGFRDRSLAEGMDAVRRSSDCHAMNSAGDCFYYVDPSDRAVLSAVARAVNKHQTVILDKSSIAKFNSSAVATTHHEASVRIIKSLFNATSSRRGMDGTAHNDYSSYMCPLHIFVASDDINVLQGAERLGYMVDSAGISQQTSTDGMLKTLLSRPELGYNATMEIISDIYFLSHCSTLLGIAASQVYRMAVALSNVTGVLRHAAAMDPEQIPRVVQLSAKYRIPFPEKFVNHGF